MDEEKIDECAHEALILMARNYLLIEELRGHEDVIKSMELEGSEASITGEFFC